MTRTKIKFCGFQTVSDVKKAIAFDIDAIGFILVPGRKRTVKLAMLKEMVQLVPEQLHTVGVLMNPTIDEIARWLQEVPLSAIQLHGDETPALCHKIKGKFPDLQLIKTFHMQQKTTPDQIKPYLPWIDLGLLDSTHAGQKGGTGRTFDWSQIPLFTAWARQMKLPLWIAGGVTPHNVHKLVDTYQPAGVDISSGVEQAGVKNQVQMKQLIEKVRLR